MICTFRSLAKEQRLLAGGKGAALARLFQAGYRVPDGFIILTTAFDGDDLKKNVWDQARVHINRMRKKAPTRSL